MTREQFREIWQDAWGLLLNFRDFLREWLQGLPVEQLNILTNVFMGIMAIITIICMIARISSCFSSRPKRSKPAARKRKRSRRSRRSGGRRKQNTNNRQTVKYRGRTYQAVDEQPEPPPTVTYQGRRYEMIDEGSNRSRRHRGGRHG